MPQAGVHEFRLELSIYIPNNGLFSSSFDESPQLPVSRAIGNWPATRACWDVDGGVRARYYAEHWCFCC